VHIEAVLEELAKKDRQKGLFQNGLGRADVLKLDIFKHGPGVNSTCMNVVQSAVLLEGVDGALRPRMNLTDGRVIICKDALDEHGLAEEEVEDAIQSLAEACENPKNQHTVTLETGQVIAFSGEVPHGRNAFFVDRENPRFALRLRGTSEKHCGLIDERNLRNPDREPYQPGV
jgi:hypothetical protein